MTQQLNGCITFWEAKLAQDSYLMAPATQALIEDTVRYLKELEKLQEEVKQRPKAKYGAARELANRKENRR